MYYKINDESKKIINVQGFQFILRVRKVTQFEVNVSIETIEQELVDEIVVADEELGVNTAREILEQSVFNWLEENTDEADRVMSAVMKW
ncbi:DUF1108 family protein [Staphylococcus nepalensis]|uniref:DUF1108 family protein n=1 Tax=Staphylococcus nepalensis TaxID=214473 RepID=A0ABS3L056_9STAP|nr:DUF1108 family protein [Staphylococcus nepalensis]MBO1213810.1 DUF1108 family protein [Staphylococcus nepalensis]MBO1214969.1 DUF1108 family protein [Staphylococcus nepalensis]MBO1226925.1 DUF1108 family protein [Staphylococcus nepalensis]MBO1234039.1 DUF1108 family protein [Staphylococcus nepalensis]MBO1236972.1 DUF1108 family protein [Staphylococcus nepalensis]